VRPHRPAARGSMEVGTPLLIVAILGAVALPNVWDRLPTVARVAAVAVLAVVALAGFLLLGKPGGLGANADLRRRRDDDDD